jgi:hypothetical protein
MKTKVHQLANNQFEISTPKGTYFQSYDSIIAFKPNDNRRIQLDSYYWNYSKTTCKYRNKFLNERIAETRAKIERKEYLLTNLNK